jgi:hypothetical protein
MFEFTERWRTRLLAAQTDLIDAYGCSRRVVEKLHYSKSQVGRWYGGNGDRDFVPMPIVMVLEGDGNVGRPIVSAILIEALGLDIAGKADADEKAACLSALSADLVETAGKLVVETVRSKADGVTTPNEAKGLRALTRKVDRIRAEIDDELAGIEAGEGRRGAVS